MPVSADKIREIRNKITLGYYSVNYETLSVQPPMKPMVLMQQPDDLEDAVLDDLKNIRRQYRTAYAAFNQVLTQAKTDKDNLFLADLCDACGATNNARAKRLYNACQAHVGEDNLSSIATLFVNMSTVL